MTRTHSRRPRLLLLAGPLAAPTLSLALLAACSSGDAATAPTSTALASAPTSSTAAQLPSYVEVPDVQGHREAKATAILENLGFTVATENLFPQVSGVEEYRVHEQVPPAGDLAEVGSTVLLRLQPEFDISGIPGTATPSPHG